MQVATELFDPSQVRTAAIVEGFREDFWSYALPAAALGGLLGSPLLYVQTDGVPATTDAYLRQTPIDFLLTVGPDVRVSEATRAEAEAALGSGVQPDPAQWAPPSRRVRSNHTTSATSRSPLEQPLSEASEALCSCRQRLELGGAANWRR
ncbi:hypothetical protein BH23ACT9_BH23ACT9_29260 [soil metagenome]